MTWLSAVGTALAGLLLAIVLAAWAVVAVLLLAAGKAVAGAGVALRHH